MRIALSAAAVLAIATWSLPASAQVPTPPPASATPAAPSSPSIAPLVPAAAPAPMPPASATPAANDGSCAAAPADVTGQLVDGLQAIGDFAKQRADEFPAKAEGTFQGLLAGLVGEELMNWIDPRDRVMSNGEIYGDWLKHGHPEAYDKMYEWAKGGGTALGVATFFDGALESLGKYGPGAIGRVARAIRPEEAASWTAAISTMAERLGGDVNRTLVVANAAAIVPTGEKMLEIARDPAISPVRKANAMVKFVGVALGGLATAHVIIAPDIGAGLSSISDAIDEGWLPPEPSSGP